MAIDAIVGAVAAVSDFIAPAAAAATDVGAGVAAADVGAGVAAADVGAAAGATALPEILVTPGAEAAAGGAAALTGAGAEAAGAAGAAGAGLTADTVAAGLAGGAGVLGATEAIGGTAGATSALNGAPLSFAPTSAAPANPLTDIGGGGGGGGFDAFAGAPAGTPGAVPSDVATALNTGEIGSLGSLGGPGETLADVLQSPIGPGSLTAGTGIAPPAPMEDVSAAVAPQIPSAAEAAGVGEGTTTVAGAGQGVTAPAIGGAAPSGLESVLNSPALRALGLIAPLGGLALTLARGQPSLPSAEQQAVNNVSPGSPVGQVATQQLTEGATGILQPGQVAQISKYVSDAKNQLYQLYARMGRDPTGDTDYIQGLAQIDQNAQIMGQQFITAAITNGLNAQGVIDATLQNAAQLQVQQDAAFQSSISAALQSFGLVAALNVVGSRGAATAPTA